MFEDHKLFGPEDTFLTSYVLFDRIAGISEISAVEAARQSIEEEIETGRLQVPDGVSFEFAGTYEKQVESEARIAVLFATGAADCLCFNLSAVPASFDGAYYLQWGRGCRRWWILCLVALWSAILFRLYHLRHIDA